MIASKTSLSQTESIPDWTSWIWQQRNAIRTVDQLLEVFPGIPAEISNAIHQNEQTRRLQITPYYLTLIQRMPGGRAPVDDDPMWRQVVPYWDGEGEATYQYDGETENWELPSEMVTPIAQR